MGAQKPLLPFRGRTLIEYIAGEVEAAAGSVTLVGCPPLAGLNAIPDLYPAFGPAGGILTALASRPVDWSLIVACDMPFVTREWFEHLFAAAAASDADAVLPVTPDGRHHPLCAVYGRSALPALERAVHLGIHTVREAIQPLRIFEVEASARLLSNINTPGEWAAVLAEQE